MTVRHGAVTVAADASRRHDPLHAHPPATAPILVVDDDPKIVALVRTYLERERYPVVTAADGRTALRAIEEEQPRLVVLDLMIPEIDGLAVIRRARELGDVPILVLSARGAVGDRILGLSEGADDYLPKPFSPAELVVRVRTILRRTERGRGARPGRRPRHRGPRARSVAPRGARWPGARGAAARSSCRLLAALLEADGRVLTRDRLLDAIHGDGEGDVTDRAIDQYVKRLREKLGDDPAEPRYVGDGARRRLSRRGPVERRAATAHATPRRGPDLRHASWSRRWSSRRSRSAVVAIGRPPGRRRVVRGADDGGGRQRRPRPRDVRRERHGRVRRSRRCVAAVAGAARRDAPRATPRPPVERIADAARRLADGDLDVRVPEEGPAGAAGPRRRVQRDGRAARRAGGRPARVHRQRLARAADAADQPAGLPRGAPRRRAAADPATSTRCARRWTA